MSSIGKDTAHPPLTSSVENSSAGAAATIGGAVVVHVGGTFDDSDGDGGVGCCSSVRLDVWTTAPNDINVCCCCFFFLALALLLRLLPVATVAAGLKEASELA